MKLLLCLQCYDIVKLHYIGSEHWCSCKRCYGVLEDHLRVSVYGPCVVLGISNLSLRYALSINDIDPREGVPFNAFIISDDSTSITRHTFDEQTSKYMAENKTCRECEQEFPNTEEYFYRRDRKGVLENICKKCKIASQGRRPRRIRYQRRKE